MKNNSISTKYNKYVILITIGRTKAFKTFTFREFNIGLTKVIIVLRLCNNVIFKISI